MKLTDNALLQFKQMIEESKTPKSGIRFFTTQGCCSPMLHMEVAENPEADDMVVKTDEVDIFVTPDADKILSSLTIDYSDGSFRSTKQQISFE